jgi:hypothetical protein
VATVYSEYRTKKEINNIVWMKAGICKEQKIRKLVRRWREENK